MGDYDDGYIAGAQDMLHAVFGALDVPTRSAGDYYDNKARRATLLRRMRGQSNARLSVLIRHELERARYVGD